MIFILHDEDFSNRFGIESHIHRFESPERQVVSEDEDQQGSDSLHSIGNATFAVGRERTGRDKTKIDRSD